MPLSRIESDNRPLLARQVPDSCGRSGDIKYEQKRVLAMNPHGATAFGKYARRVSPPPYDIPQLSFSYNP